ncbi:MAG: hypothetical protein Q8762_01405 [Pigeon pea little leaf phytoplasma]|uniref:Uncharacterized protein n=1 Tax=Candidatus Phytoplasma fabacearum TaxID=2982628 RepID=A0ABU8ZSH7_9MOLU|nr:hypothetical protein ['Bituminaria bituminosa' little leaf phytoplasma]MDV3158110.1 hypothetical protein [Pigeon pea little leaf phytoplasma]MDV3158688.1 hypothetical protein [Pigeon pea little leaf phytoplasma]MDV3164356.1 hypothetical protein [Pigeon pea little leaf phytoplasma]MDV3195810.1 hypothetical protein [Pigeon pea little leaf phytoplasma]MDV3200316.1 hypothetical protein [Pigeon pea little leaf phytoplasma]
MNNIEIQFTGITLFFIFLFILFTFLLFYLFYKWGYFCGMNDKNVIFPVIVSFLIGFGGGILFVVIGYQVGSNEKNKNKK